MKKSLRTGLACLAIFGVWVTISGGDERTRESPEPSGSDPDRVADNGTPVSDEQAVSVRSERFDQTGRAPPGRGGTGRTIRASNVSSEGSESNEHPRRNQMNGEVFADVRYEDDSPVDQWRLISEDCSVMATIHEGTARTLSPPGPCVFGIVGTLGEAPLDDEWVEVEVRPNETVYLNFVVPMPRADTAG